MAAQNAHETGHWADVIEYDNERNVYTIKIQPTDETRVVGEHRLHRSPYKFRFENDENVLFHHDESGILDGVVKSRKWDIRRELAGPDTRKELYNVWVEDVGKEFEDIPVGKLEAHESPNQHDTPPSSAIPALRNHHRIFR